MISSPFGSTGDLPDARLQSNVQLPLPTKDEKTIDLDIYREVDAYLKDQLLFKRKAYAAHFYHNGAWWVRCSAQVYNEVCFVL